MKYLLGIDVGTSGTKSVLFDIYGNEVSSKTVSYPLYEEQNGWAEQDPLHWWNAVVTGVRAVLSKAGQNCEIAGVGLSGQMHGLVMLSKDGVPLRKSIIWCDQRTAAQCEEINSKVGEKRVIEITANPPMTGFTASKILWVMENEPHIYSQCKSILLPKDYIRYMLTGELATEVSDASGMQLMDIKNRTWSDEVLKKLSIDKSLLAAMYESEEQTGTVSKTAAELTGIKEGTPVAGGAGDNAAAAIGTGVIKEGSAFTTIGSSAVVYAVSDEPLINALGKVHTLCASVKNKWTVMSCTQGAGISLRWLRNTCFEKEAYEAEKQGTDTYALMDKMAEKVPIGAEKLIYLPYLMGERSPHPDPYCKGVFFGLSNTHSKAHLVRAVLEGVAFSQKECVDVFREMGVDVSDMTVCGGGGRSPLWRQMLSDLYGCPVKTLKADEGGALGVAILAGVCSKEYSSLQEACDLIVKKNEPLMPDKEAGKLYEPYFELYKKLYKSLKDDFRTLYNI
ncbi:MAG: xylulokinase [Clostridiales bacterium]|jgi:xylulokinase|nr:xylulokinase [Clostridiales bacterium]